jgi:hypothetical protein
MAVHGDELLDGGAGGSAGSAADTAAALPTVAKVSI